MFDEKMGEQARTAGKAQEMQGQMDQPLPPPGAPMDPAAMGGPAPGGMEMPGGGAPMPMPGGGGGAPSGAPGAATLDEMDVQAEQMAQQILTMDPTTRRSELVNLKHSDETLHALVKSKLDTLEQQAAQTGIQMTRQGQMPPPGAM